MKTIETKPGVTLGFKESDRHRSVTEFILDNNCLIKNKDIIGRLSEITEEQAKELVLHPEDVLHGNEWHPLYKDYTSSIFKSLAIGSLYSAAESLGIKESEFEKYLVIKL
jgi:hypothetical protein